MKAIAIGGEDQQMELGWLIEFGCSSVPMVGSGEKENKREEAHLANRSGHRLDRSYTLNISEANSAIWSAQDCLLAGQQKGTTYGSLGSIDGVCIGILGGDFAGRLAFADEGSLTQG